MCVGRSQMMTGTLECGYFYNLLHFVAVEPHYHLLGLKMYGIYSSEAKCHEKIEQVVFVCLFYS